MELASLFFRFLLAFVFIAASIPKLAAHEEFAGAVANYRLLPHVLVDPVARWLPRVELAVGVALIVGVALAPIALFAAATLLVFSAAVAWNLLHGRRIECGCAGTSVPREISWRLVARDVALTAFAVALAIAPPDTLALPHPWPLGAGGEASNLDGMAVFLISALVVLGETLIVDAVRTRKALDAFVRAELIS
jgi:hypothetical protein